MLNIIKGPYLQWATPQHMTIVWETTTAATGEVSYFETTRVHADGNGRFHYPPYVSADYQVDAMRVLCPMVEEYGVDLVFNSHTIVYERSHPIRGGKIDLDRGIVYVVAGGAGNYARWFHAKRAWHTAQALGVPHFVQVTIADRRLELQAIDVEGRLFDRLVLTKPAYQTRDDKRKE